jgi:membrane protein involved in colicin uptake
MTTNANVTLNSQGEDIHAASNRLIAAYVAKKNAELEIQAAEEAIAKAEAKAKKTAEVANALIPADAVIDQTYNGLSGCACGCGGDYTEDGVNTGKAKARINKINKFYNDNPLNVEIDNYGDRTMYQITTSVGEEFDRVTRVYIKNAGN